MRNHLMGFQIHLFDQIEPAASVYPLGIRIVGKNKEAQIVKTGFPGLLLCHVDESDTDALAPVFFIHAQGVQQKAVFNAGGEKMPQMLESFRRDEFSHLRRYPVRR